MTVVSLPRLVREVRRLRRRGKSIAFTNGCFDLLHAGHLEYLEKVKSRADVLIVALNSDRSVRRLKGPGRPLVPEGERARLVAALRPVDFVTIFSEPTPLKAIRAVQPDLLAKGGDWKAKAIVGREIVEGRGGKVLVIPYLKGHSTTGLVRRIRGR
ncbi:MAG: adenylyltransferase/cytidyltransferase family protein [Candidatus Omnitrophica bacterium]|nr:adenylyltransferase/cytidyltransferase family protein [Candidatus Omnitrophota bacterium]